MGGPGMTTTGGNAIPFYASIRMNVIKIERIEWGGQPVGHKAKILVEKNKLAPPYKETVVDLYYGSGMCSITDMVDLAIKSGIVIQAGAWYSLLDNKIQGMHNFIDLLLKNRNLLELIRDTLIRLYEIPLTSPEAYLDKHILYSTPDEIKKVDDLEAYMKQLEPDSQSAKEDCE